MYRTHYGYMLKLRTYRHSSKSTASKLPICSSSSIKIQLSKEALPPPVSKHLYWNHHNMNEKKPWQYLSAAPQKSHPWSPAPNEGISLIQWTHVYDNTSWSMASVPWHKRDLEVQYLQNKSAAHRHMFKSIPCSPVRELHLKSSTYRTNSLVHVTLHLVVQHKSDLEVHHKRAVLEEQHLQNGSVLVYMLCSTVPCSPHKRELEAPTEQIEAAFVHTSTTVP